MKRFFEMARPCKSIGTDREAAEYPPVPQDPSIDSLKDYYALGWLLDQPGKDRLRAFHATVWGGPRREFTPWVSALYGESLPGFKKQGAIKTILLHWARKDWVDRHCPPGGWVSRHGGYSERTEEDSTWDAIEAKGHARKGVPMLAIAFTFSRKTFYHRVTQTQFDWLQALFGKAHWFLSQTKIDEYLPPPDLWEGQTVRWTPKEGSTSAVLTVWLCTHTLGMYEKLITNACRKALVASWSDTLRRRSLCARCLSGSLNLLTAHRLFRRDKTFPSIVELALPRGTETRRACVEGIGRGNTS